MQSSADTLTVYVPHSIHLLRGLNLIVSVSVPTTWSLTSESFGACGLGLTGTHFNRVFSIAMDPNSFMDEKCESRLYIGNLDLRITEASLIKMFSPFGEIVSEDFLWHTRGPKRGAPRGYAFVQFRNKEEAKLAKEKMHGNLVCGRPMVVRLASEKYLAEMTENSSTKAPGEASKSALATGGSSGQMSRSAKIAAIKNKLKAMEEDNRETKKLKQSDP